MDKFNPVSISLWALGISILSLLFTIFNTSLSRRIERENIRGEMVIRLTIIGVRLLDDIRIFLDREGADLKIAQILSEVADGLVKMRESLKSFNLSSFLIWEMLTPELLKIQLKLKDSEHIFEKLSKAIADSNNERTKVLATGLHERIHGNKKFLGPCLDKGIKNKYDEV